VALYNVTQMLNGTLSYQKAITPDDMAKASASLQDYLGSGGESRYAAPCAKSVAACIAAGAIPSAAEFAAKRAGFASLLTYGLPSIRPTDLAPVGPDRAEGLP